jgi:hypothetical protein
VADCKAEGLKAGFPARTMERAAKQVGCVLGFKMVEGKRVYYYELVGELAN